MATLPPECPIEVRIATTKAIWFDLVFVAGNQGRIVETSDTMWSIGELVSWLKHIAADTPSTIMEIDREGAIDAVEAIRLDDQRTHLRIYDALKAVDAGGTPVYFIDAVVSRRKLVWEIYHDMQKLAPKLGYHYRPEYQRTDPDWLKIPEVEAWLEWDKHQNWYDDDLIGAYR